MHLTCEGMGWGSGGYAVLLLIFSVFYDCNQFLNLALWAGIKMEKYHEVTYNTKISNAFRNWSLVTTTKRMFSRVQHTGSKKLWSNDAKINL